MTSPADRRSIRTMRGRIDELLRRFATLRAQNQKVPKPRPVAEVLSGLRPRERALVQAVAAAAAAQQRYGADALQTQQLNRVVERHTERFETTYRDRDEPARDQRPSAVDTLTNAAVAVAIGYAIHEALPEPIAIDAAVGEQYGLAAAAVENDSAAADVSAADDVVEPAVTAATQEQEPAAVETSSWVDGIEGVTPELLDALAAADESHPHDLTDMLNAQAGTEVDYDEPGVGAANRIEAGLTV
ncbi:hypothetical protein JO861_18905 [Rhodococcus hoagii]|uniref:hypothetical protein n=1 Tax=Rhodococcus hoagii TaxID=43767 RepID=UPI00196253FB|nr:hypothetical protein [Prescottella equi]MBM9838620.1 hypothetical protein [Prescottella equi]